MAHDNLSKHQLYICIIKQKGKYGIYSYSIYLTWDNGILYASVELEPEPERKLYVLSNAHCDSKLRHEVEGARVDEVEGEYMNA